MVNIVYLIPCFRNAGPVNVVLDIVRHLDYSCFHATIITLRKEKGALCNKDKFLSLPVDIIEFDFSRVNIFLYPRLIAKIINKRICKLENVIIHSHCHRPNAICKYLSKYKKITTVHNISEEDASARLGKYVGRYVANNYNKTLRYFDCSVVISNYMKDYYAGKACKIIKICNGVSFSKQVDFDINGFKIANQIDLNKKIIIIAGVFIPRKNVLFAISELKKVEDDFLCLLLGKGETMNDCINLVGSDMRFRFEGFKTNVIDYLSIADLYISSSLSEGLPLSVLEAINVGVPCLLSDIRPHLEIVNTLKVEGVKCYELKENCLTKRAKEFLNKDFDRIKIAREAYLNYSSHVMAKGYQNLYKEIIGK